MEPHPPARGKSVSACLITAAAGLLVCGGLLAYALIMESGGFRQSTALSAGWVRVAATVSFYLFAALGAALLVSLSFALFRGWQGSSRLWRLLAVVLAVSWGIFAAAVLLALLRDLSAVLTRYSPLSGGMEETTTARRLPSGERLAEDER